MKKIIAAVVVLLSVVSNGLAQSWTFSTTPTSGNIQGNPGEKIGWGFTITNNSNDWLFASIVSVSNPGNLNIGLFDNSILFNNYPIVAPGETVSRNYNSSIGEGLAEFTINNSALPGNMNSEFFELQGFWYDDDPFNNGNYLGEAGTKTAPFSVKVSGLSAPEPTSIALASFAIAPFIYFLRKRRKKD